jgi:hypothetical protein
LYKEIDEIYKKDKEKNKWVVFNLKYF